MNHAARIEGQRQLNELEVIVRFVTALRDKLPPEVWEKVNQYREQWSDEYLNRKAAQRGQ